MEQLYVALKQLAWVLTMRLRGSLLVHGWQASGVARRLIIGTAPLLIVGEQTELDQHIHLGCCKVPAL